MKDVWFALPGTLLTILCWGMYGSVLHKGQHDLGNDRLKPLICVGLAYFVVAIIVPGLALVLSGKLTSDWTVSGVTWSSAAGVAGACGAFGIILAFTLGPWLTAGTADKVAGGNPIYVMPLVFGGAPIINVFVTMLFLRAQGKHFDYYPQFFIGMALVILGAGMVLVYKPTPKAVTSPPVSDHAVHDKSAAGS